MSSLEVRSRLLLDDARGISELFQARIPVWQRVDSEGHVEDVPYNALTIYERWLHGGPWMSIETAALHLSHLLQGAGLAVVAVRDGKVVGYGEAYHGIEPAPYGEHLHVALIVTHPEEAGDSAEHAILDHLMEQARTTRCQRLMVHCAAADEARQALYRGHGMKPLVRVNRYSLPARSGQGFYRTGEHLDANPAQIDGWSMPVGRTGGARQQWESLWPRTWQAIPEIAGRRTHRVHLSAAGQEALIYMQEQLFAPRSAEVFIWSPRPLTTQVVTAVRDWSHREGYRTLVMAVSEDTVKALGSDAEPDGTFIDLYSVDTGGA